MRKKSSSSRIVVHTAFVFFMSGLCLLVGILVFSNFFTTAYDAIVENNSRSNNSIVEEISLTISADSSLESIASFLHEEGYIGNHLLFITQGKLSDADQNLIPGEYTISSQMTNSTILDLITTLPEEQVAYIRLTIPEGFTVEQIANRIEDLNLVSKEEFLHAANTKTYPFTFLNDIPTNAKVPLEGYLFPDTYFIHPNAAAEDIIMMLLKRFDEVTSPYSSYLHNSSYTLHDIITIASIIEAEARVAEERPLISGVIYNRLANDMKLQMCSTVQYALGTRKEQLNLDDLAIDSPYNTYLYEGLPLSPIASPGINSIKAAFIPEHHNYYFFVLNNIEKGTHSFSETAEEHSLNKQKYNQQTDPNFLD